MGSGAGQGGVGVAKEGFAFDLAGVGAAWGFGVGEGHLGVDLGSPGPWYSFQNV